jgi:acyl dehydratase
VNSQVHDTRNERFGGFLHDYVVGDVYRHWPGKTITEAENHLFCLLTLANSPIHTDREYAEHETIFGQNVIVGTYIYSLLLGMSVPDISGRALANLGVKELHHLAPMFAGDTLYAESTILDVRLSTKSVDRGVLTVSTRGTNQTGDLVCSFERAVLLPVRPLVPTEGDSSTR